MKVLVIGRGAREHALVWRLNQSQLVRKLYCASGNPGINQIAEPVAIAPTDIAKLLDFARETSVDLTVVGPEDPLAAGIVDEFERASMPIVGPTRAAAELEISKAFAKTVMREADVPTAAFAVFDDAAAAHRHVRALNSPVVVKADGLTLGKGVVVCRDAASADAAIADAMEQRKFGAAGARIVIEELLAGEEASFFALTDGENAVPLGLIQDHKTIFDGDRGPNTGGMGAYAPVPQFGAELEERIMREVIRPTLAAMAARGTQYRGVLYAGLMISGDRINVIEFNARFGDPECEVIMMRWESDLAEALLAVAEHKAGGVRVRCSPRSAVTVVLASGGYPGDYRRGIPIAGLEKIEGAEPSPRKVQWALNKSRVKVFHAGTALKDGTLVTAGGRVLAVTAMAQDLPAAVATAYQAADMIEFDGMHLRRDIAGRALARLPGSG